MDYDIKLAERSISGLNSFAFYRWNPYCISLGANQKFDTKSILVKQNEMGLMLLKDQPGEEQFFMRKNLLIRLFCHSILIYSKKIYQEINLAIIEGLKFMVLNYGFS